MILFHRAAHQSPVIAKLAGATFCVFAVPIILTPHKWRMTNTTRPTVNQHFSREVMATFSRCNNRPVDDCVAYPLKSYRVQTGC